MSTQCRSCMQQAAMRPETRQRRLENERKRLPLRKYGLHPHQIDAMLVAQGGRCIGCDVVLDLGRNTHIDHCHGTGKVRGILCYLCNVGLGSMRDSPRTMRRLADYIEHHNGK